jgi:hypothetical protein
MVLWQLRAAHTRKFFLTATVDPTGSPDPMRGAGTKDKKPRLAEHEVEHVVSIMEMVRVYVN